MFADSSLQATAPSQRFATSCPRVHGIIPGFGELQALKIHDMVGYDRLASLRKLHLQGALQGWHDGAAIFVDERHPDRHNALFVKPEANPICDRAGRVDHGKIAGDDRVECPQNVQLALRVASGRIAERSNFDFHGRNPIRGRGRRHPALA